MNSRFPWIFRRRLAAVLVAAGILSGAGAAERDFTDEDRAWWAVQPVTSPAVPAAGGDWARNGIDRFVARRLKDAGLEPAPEASRRELVRRAYLDLHGLPPTPVQVAAFLKDDRPDAWARLVDELLASPRYGERWAQHWLDIARYSESDGYRQDAYRPTAHHYRDYVIKSFNDDKPYDHFVREQLAGDELDADNPDVVIGTAFLRHGIYEYNQRNTRMHWELIMNEMTNVTGEVFLGLGVGCAQCHDHKFDPILQKDYYALQAFLANTVWPTDRVLATPKEVARHAEAQREWEEATAEIREELEALLANAYESKAAYSLTQFPEDIQAIHGKPREARTPYEQQMVMLVDRQIVWQKSRVDPKKTLKDKPAKLERFHELQEALKEFDERKPEPLPMAFTATDVDREPANAKLTTRRGTETIEPAFPALLGLPEPEIRPTKTTTGRRTALANWITSPDNPLSTRVIVNRIWQYHFGSGLVVTANDFGTLGEPPSHPELLDWMTQRFLAGGWRMKEMHALIMNSATYRQTARREPAAKEATTDPANRLLWRFPPQRLDAEQVRDAMLAVSGELRHRLEGPSVAGTEPFRSVYVKKIRNTPDAMLGGFDAPMGFDSAPDRIATTTPTQSLLLVNGDWALDRAKAFARRLLDGGEEVGAVEIRRAYHAAYGRAPRAREVDAALGFIEGQLDEVAAPEAEADPFADETGFRPLGDAFRGIEGVPLGSRALWLQPGSRFERLHLAGIELAEQEFTVEAVVRLDRTHRDASVNTLISQWNGDRATRGWSLGVTSEKSKYTPQNLIVQLIGDNFQGTAVYEVVASGLHVPLGKPVYVAAAISARAQPENPTTGTVTFYLKDLSDPDAKLQVRTIEHSVVERMVTPGLKLLVGGREARGHLWDGQVARLAVGRGVLSTERLLVGPDGARSGSRLLDFDFSRGDEQHPAPGAAWHRDPAADEDGVISPRLLGAMTDFCHALLNSNEFLYLH